MKHISAISLFVAAALLDGKASGFLSPSASALTTTRSTTLFAKERGSGYGPPLDNVSLNRCA